MWLISPSKPNQDANVTSVEKTLPSVRDIYRSSVTDLQRSQFIDKRIYVGNSYVVSVDAPANSLIHMTATNALYFGKYITKYNFNLYFPESYKSRLVGFAKDVPFSNVECTYKGHYNFTDCQFIDYTYSPKD